MKRLVNKVKIYSNNNDKSISIKKILEVKLLENNYEIVDEGYDLVIAIGGDGAFIRMLKSVQFNPDPYYIGINTGTLGFAQEVNSERLDDFIYKLNNNKYKVDEIGIEEISINYDGGVSNFYALNELTIRDSELNTTKLDIKIDGHFLETFVGDGILISTSFGSTAYNLSFGGSIIYNTLHTLQITPIAPFNAKTFKNLFNSVVVPQDSIISILPLEEKRNLIVSIDGENKTYNGVTLIETFVKNKRIKCLREEDYNFIDKVKEKFLS